MEKRYGERIELHCHTGKSEGYGLCEPEDILLYIKDQGMTAVAFTDFGNLLSYPDIQEVFKRDHGIIKPIYGLELLVAEDILSLEEVAGNVMIEGLPAHHVLILIKNETGRKNLFSLLTEANLQAKERTPWITWSRLLELREGLLLGSSGSSGGLQSSIFRGSADKTIQELIKRFDFLEIQPVSNNRWMDTGAGEEIDMSLVRKKINQTIVSLGEENKIPVVATSESHYLRKEEADSWKILMLSMNRHKEMNDDLHFRTTIEMLEEFAYLGKEKAYEVVVFNTNQIAEQIEFLMPIKNERSMIRIKEAEKELRMLCEKEARIRWGNVIPESVRVCLKEELDLIIQNGFETRFIHYYKLLSQLHLHPSQYHLGGLAAASIVCFVLGISQTDPLNKEFPLYSEFAMGLCGDREPMIELKFDKDLEESAISTLEEMPEISHCLRTFHHYHPSAKIINQWIRDYEKWSETTIQAERQEEIKKLLEKCLFRKGIRATNEVLIIPSEVDETDYFPLDLDATGRYVGAHFSSGDVDHMFTRYHISGEQLCTILHKLYQRTKYYPTQKDITAPEFLEQIPRILKRMASYGITINDAWNDFLHMIELSHPKTLPEYMILKAMLRSRGAWEQNGEELIKMRKPLAALITTREDVYEFLLKIGFNKETAFQFAETVRKGMFCTSFHQLINRLDTDEETTKIPEWFLESCKKIRYLPSRAQIAEAFMQELRILYYVWYHPEEARDILTKE